MRAQRILSLGNFLSSAHFFLIIYILAPFMAQVMPAGTSGLVISLGAIVTLTAFPLLPRFVGVHGAKKLAIVFALFESAVLFALYINPSPLLSILLVVLACATSPLLAYQLDLLLEASVTDEHETGRVRTKFLTAANIALILAPLAIGFILGSTSEYEKVFLVASLTLLPFIALISLASFKTVVVPTVSSLGDATACILRDRDLRAIAFCNICLQFFFHLAPLYVPLYLHNVLGIPWSTLGIIFAVMLIPFVLIEYPAGYLADTRYGDKLFMIIGFVLMGGAFALTAFITTSTSLLVIVLILVLSRVGAAFVEAMTEGHFFRRVSDRDTNTVMVFRMMRPGGALIAPIIGSLILSVTGYQNLFIITGILVAVAGVASARYLHELQPVLPTNDNSAFKV